MDIDKLVGNTPMIKIDYEYEGKKGSIYSKVEYYNYSGSIKDRIALYKKKMRALQDLEESNIEFESYKFLDD
ncbi:MAG: hypothetical protein IKV87_08320, partial [Methanobrevibacter sp.]|nr:hypothetical protein [Methanobrevibacter sp.]